MAPIVGPYAVPGRQAAAIEGVPTAASRSLGDRWSALESSASEPRLQASLAVLAVLILQLRLPDKLTAGPQWLLPGLEALLLVPLTLVNPYRDKRETRLARTASITLLALVNLANVYSLVLLVRLLLDAGSKASGHRLILSAVVVWLTLVVTFGLAFWEFDSGGPARRAEPGKRVPDLMFPQDANPEVAPADWAPRFFDYLYTAFMNASAFSPTDTLPLSRWAKLLFLTESLTSLVTVVLVGARAVNILNS
jgi:uncharacterized membrane protein